MVHWCILIHAGAAASTVHDEAIHNFEFVHYTVYFDSCAAYSTIKRVLEQCYPQTADVHLIQLVLQTLRKQMEIIACGEKNGKVNSDPRTKTKGFI